ncbi:MAG: MarR family transcriptional regulator [Pseudomonadales bacterium]|nr:MarR family transcriptional regulator [Pseudomonadales bacterium]
MFNLVNFDETLKLDNQFCFVLYALSRKITSLYRPLLKPLGLTYPQYLVMLLLWEAQRADSSESKEQKGVSIKYLGERLYLDTGTLTPLLKRMESQGLLTRVRSQLDEREVLVTLTDAGIDLKERAKQIPMDLLCQSNMPLDKIGPLQSELKALLALTSEN